MDAVDPPIQIDNDADDAPDLQADRFIDAFNEAIEARELAADAAKRASDLYVLAVHAQTLLEAAQAAANQSNVPGAVSQALVGHAEAAAARAWVEANFLDEEAARLAREAAKADALADKEAGELPDGAAGNERVIKIGLDLIASRTNARAALSADWEEFMKSQSDIGMFTIMVMHHKNWWNNVWIWFLLFLVLIAQFMLPSLLLLYARQTYIIVEFCPMSADGIAKAVASAIGCIYIVRIVFMLTSKASEHSVAIKTDHASFGKFVRLRLSVARFLDHCMNMWYEVFVYAINLFIVFVTPDPLNMVLNSLAFEFILQLDDVVKEKYISILMHWENKAISIAMHGEDNQTPKNQNSVIEAYDKQFYLTRDAKPPAHSMYDALIEVMPLRVLAWVLPVLILFYLPYCKPV
ncbi:hypothetical protein MHU86_11696 [Fragilaria crotonensis]|nr:hypothetical protein MHU86_11696 [Fragilaria crotonensis]